MMSVTKPPRAALWLDRVARIVSLARAEHIVLEWLASTVRDAMNGAAMIAFAPRVEAGWNSAETQAGTTPSGAANAPRWERSRVVA
ncbi:MAG TPA: hypothetical protein VFP68_22960 [Burkholderiaceae bacterium]|nr:hypothetical protein [Burkholderiaceae bacterium]